MPPGGARTVIFMQYLAAILAGGVSSKNSTRFPRCAAARPDKHAIVAGYGNR